MRKERKILRFVPQKLRKVLRMETLILPNIFQSLTQKTLGITEKKLT